MKKRLMCLLLVFSMLLSLAPAGVLAAGDDGQAQPAVDPENPFTDVAEDDWFYDAVQYVRMNGIFNGTSDTTFDPNGYMTRGMFVTVLGRMAGVDTDAYSGASSFEDVDPDVYYAPYVAWASKHGITQGTGEGRFSPDESINRQQMATFFVRYFDTFNVVYDTGEKIDSLPADMDLVADWAKDSVTALWETGILNGDGVSFHPTALANRAQAAALCMRADAAVETWYKEPGVESDRNPSDDDSSDVIEVPVCRVNFYDGKRCFATLYAMLNEPLGKLPPVEKSSKEGAVLLGYYTDPEFTQPFYAEERVTKNMDVYAKYQELDSLELLNLTSFAQMDQNPDLSFSIRRVSGNVAPENAASLSAKDGSDPVNISISDSDGDGVYTVYAPAGFNKGCTYELTLAEGWIFDGKADTIRTASFSIKMAEVENLRMSEDIVYIPDTAVSGNYTINYTVGGIPASKSYSVLKADAMSIEGADLSTISGSFTYTGSESIQPGDLLCIYVGLHPNDRIDLSNDDDPTNDGALMDPAVYVKVKGVSNGIITFVPMDEADQQKLYEVPDLFPFLVTELPSSEAEELIINIGDFDLSLYETVMGKEEGTLEKAKGKVSPRDFVVLYTQLSQQPEEGELFYGYITHYDSATGVITFVPSSEAELMSCMDLYSVVDIQGYDLVSEQQRQYLEQTLYAQVDESGFADEAAYILADLVTKTDGFRDDLKIQDFLLTDSQGNPLSQEEIQLLNLGGSFELTDDVELSVELITGGEQLHFNQGVQLAIGVDASFEVEVEDGKVAIDLSATFVQEVTVKPSVKGGLTYKEVLGVNWPNGVQVNASIDVKSYTALSFAAEIYTVAEEDADLWSQLQGMVSDPTSVLGLAGIPEDMVEELKTVADVMDKIEEIQNTIDQAKLDLMSLLEYEEDIRALWRVLERNDLASRNEWEELCRALGKTSITSDLMDMMNLSSETGLSAQYYDSVEALLQKYSDTVTKETDWVKLLEEEIFTAEVCVSGICIGVEVSFVVRADMSIAIGSNLEYEVGKRYSFWFRIGLYTPTAGSDTTDLIDERFGFQFYVMGKLGVKAGVKALLYAGIGTKTVASVGIAAELGPYIKLYGFFVYEYSKYRPANTQNWTYEERMAGALFMEFGLYFMLSFEAQALSLFEYSHDFLDEEIPLLTAGDDRYYYKMNYDPAKDEVVIIRDENGDASDGTTMLLSDELRALSYIDLVTGRFGSEALPYSRYKISVSNPAFSIDPEGRVSVDVPEDVRFLECDLTITYLHGKMAFSSYDMSVTIPLVWTDLTVNELKEYYTASVRVGNDGDGYDTVWTKKVLKRQPFDLPGTEEVKDIISWSDAKYVMGEGYGDQVLTDLTIIEDSAYEFKINYPTYSLTVTGIQNPDGSTRSEVFTAKYGQSFDFSGLENTGTEIPGSTYTKFSGVSTQATVMVNGKPQVIDLTQPVNTKVAEALAKGVTATANYVDDSVKAIFSFSGITAEDVVVTLRRGQVPGLAAVQQVVDNTGDEGVSITDIYPAIGAIDHTTNYTVTCIKLSGQRNTVHFDLQEGFINGQPSLASVDKLIGSLLVNLPDAPDMARTGYDFDGWFTQPKGEVLFSNPGENALTQTVPAREYEGEAEIPYTLYAQWTSKTFQVTFNLNGGQSLMVKESLDQTIGYKVNDDKQAPYQMTVVYDSSFGKAYAYTEGADNLKDLANAEFYGYLPIPYRDSDYGFAGWYYDADGDGVLFEEGELVTEDTVVKLSGNITLYARWKTLVDIGKGVYSITAKTYTYNGDGRGAVIDLVGGKGSYYYLDDPDTLHYLDYPTEGYDVKYMRQTSEQYVRRTELPHVAGTYNVYIDRSRDNDFAAMSWRYDNALKINKASSSLSGTPYVADSEGMAIVGGVNNLSRTGDGALQYAVTSSSGSVPGTWFNNGAIYNLKSGTYYLWARLGEGMNYEASDPIGPVQFTVTSAKHEFRYALWVHTSNTDQAGTSEKVYAKIGDGNWQHLALDNVNDFEQNSKDTYFVSVDNSLPGADGQMDVGIKIDKSGIAIDWHWKLGSLRMDVYEISYNGGLIPSLNRIAQGTEKVIEEWFDEDGQSETYTLTVPTRSVDTSSYGLSLSGSTISINETITDAYKGTYSPYAYENAPRFVAYFGSPNATNAEQQSIFNKYITRVDLYTFRIDWDGLYEAMDEYRITSLTLCYGITYSNDVGVAGASDYILTETITTTLPY